MLGSGSTRCPPVAGPRLRAVSGSVAPQRYCRVHTHFPDELLHRFVQTIVGEVELRGDPLCLVGESHAALGMGVEGAFELDSLLGFRADLGLVEEYGVAESNAWRADVPTLVFSKEAQDRVREVGCEDLEEKR